jgi:hypothetical protein
MAEAEEVVGVEEEENVETGPAENLRDVSHSTALTMCSNWGVPIIPLRLCYVSIY